MKTFLIILVVVLGLIALVVFLLYNFLKIFSPAAASLLRDFLLPFKRGF